MATPLASNVAQTATNIIFGLTATLIGFVTVWQGHKAWTIWRDHRRQSDEGEDVERNPDSRNYPSSRRTKRS